ncbi:MAG: hypothetical protein HQ517_15080 [SAR324 cluster bacterium]|nr:hypothetical protein [SAR324 cluster bacterium]
MEEEMLDDRLNFTRKRKKIKTNSRSKNTGFNRFDEEKAAEKNFKKLAQREKKIKKIRGDQWEEWFEH